jgi:hypothetical protein
MGVSLHYRGRINDLAAIPRLREELADIAATMGWRCDPFDEDFAQPPSLVVSHDKDGACLLGHAGLKGVVFWPHPKCEPVSVLFDAEGNLRDLMGMLSICDGTCAPQEAWVHVKTQFAGADTHIALVKLLRYLKRAYVSDLQVRDEGEYWDTDDADRVARKIDFLNGRIEALKEELQHTPRPDAPDSDVTSVARKIEETIERIWKDGAPQEVLCGRSPNCPPEVHAAFLEHVEALENAPMSTLYKELTARGVEVPPPEEVDDEHLHEKLWEIIHALAKMRTYMDCTDHMSDRELYEKLWNESLHEEDQVTLFEAGWNSHLDFLCRGDEEGIRAYLKYYADEQTRTRWKEDFPDHDMPAHEDPPYHRDIELPQPELPGR